MDRNIDYYPIVAKFAMEHGLCMSCSNGVFKLGPTKNSVLHYTETAQSKEEVEKFKSLNPEYSNMKGIKHKEPTSVIYNIEVSDRGETINNTLRESGLKRALKQETNYSIDNLIFLEHMFRNKYRYLKEKLLCKNYAKSQRLIRIMIELNLLEKSFNKKGKAILRLTEKGQNYVKQSRVSGYSERDYRKTTETN